MRQLTPEVAWTSCRHHFAPNHPTGEGHFPGNPIIPGAVALQQLIRALTQVYGMIFPCEIEQAKFLLPIRPGDHVTIRWCLRQAGGYTFEIVSDGEDNPALTGILVPHKKNEGGE